MKKGKTLRVAALMTATAFATMMMLAACGEKPVEHTHTLQEVAAVAATCTTAGNEAYYKCTDTTCGKLFSDAEGKTEITAIPTIAATGHDMTKHDEVSATCTTDGTKEYYTCSHEAATVYYADEQGSETLTDLTIKANGHDMTKHDAVAPTCDSEGNKAYWTCANELGVVYANAEGTETTTMDQITVAKRQHSIEPVEAVPATCAAPGKQAHFECLNCHKLYSDADGQQLIEDENSLVIPKSETHTGMQIFNYDTAPTVTAEGGELDATCSDCKQAIKVQYQKSVTGQTSARNAEIIDMTTSSVYISSVVGRNYVYVAAKVTEAGTYTLSFRKVFTGREEVYGWVANVSVGTGSVNTSTSASKGAILYNGALQKNCNDLGEKIKEMLLFNGAAYDPDIAMGTSDGRPRDNIDITFTVDQSDVGTDGFYLTVGYQYPSIQANDPANGLLVMLNKTNA